MTSISIKNYVVLNNKFYSWLVKMTNILVKVINILVNVVDIVANELWNGYMVAPNSDLGRVPSAFKLDHGWVLVCVP